MQVCNSITSPLEPNQQLMAAANGEESGNSTFYQQIIGSIMYFVSRTRPDFAYTITHLNGLIQIHLISIMKM